jgi:hypothetical protein
VTGRTEVTTLARKGQKIFMTALSTSDPGETVTQNPTVQIAVDDGPQIGTIKPIGPLKTLLMDPFKLLEMILNTLIICRILAPARSVEAIFRRAFSPLPDTMLSRDKRRLPPAVHLH